jgi:16S rRNA (uracil1498-N3)-methyltransferase
VVRAGFAEEVTADYTDKRNAVAVKSIYLPDPVLEGDRIRVTGEEHHHLQVSRTEEKEDVEVFDGRGGVWSTQVEMSAKRETLLRVVEFRQIEKRGPELILGLSLIKASAFELALEKVVEVGIERIIPVVSSRSNAAPPRRTDRWQRIVIEAAKQSKQYYLPSIEPATRFDDVLAIPAVTKIVFAERDGGPLKSALVGSPVLFLVGPEGGWTDAEVDAARHSGFHPISLGDGILRSETAAITGAALIRYELEQVL